MWYAQAFHSVCWKPEFWKNKIEYDFGLAWSVPITVNPRITYQELVKARQELKEGHENEETLFYSTILGKLPNAYNLLFSIVDLDKIGVNAILVALMTKNHQVFNQIYTLLRSRLTDG